jgi:hypothetical protein
MKIEDLISSPAPTTNGKTSVSDVSVPTSAPPHLKRQASSTPLPVETLAKKQSKWTPEEDDIVIELKGNGTKWDDIAKRLPGRSSIACRLRYQNYLEKDRTWDEEKKIKFAMLYAQYVQSSLVLISHLNIAKSLYTTRPCLTCRNINADLYTRFKNKMWQVVATKMGIGWQSAESMHWQLGEQEMDKRAKAPVPQLSPRATVTLPLPVPSASSNVGFTPVNATHRSSQVWEEEQKNKFAMLYAQYVQSSLVLISHLNIAKSLYTTRPCLTCRNINADMYTRFKDEMWQVVATKMGIPWRLAESMHWQLGEQVLKRVDSLLIPLT